MKIITLIFFLVLSPAFVFSEEPGIPPGTDLALLLNKPQVIHSAVSAERLEDKTQWITMDMDAHVFIDLPFDAVCKSAKKFENYAVVFKRIKSSHVIVSPEAVLLELLFSVGLMGIRVETICTMTVTESVDTPERLMLDYAFYSGDGLVKEDAHGTWYIEAVTINGITGSYIRCTMHGVVMKKYPLQRGIMNMFIDMETADALKQFIKAARNPPE